MREKKPRQGLPTAKLQSLLCVCVCAPVVMVVGASDRQASLMTGVISVPQVTVVLALGIRNESSHYELSKCQPWTRGPVRKQSS